MPNRIERIFALALAALPLAVPGAVLAEARQETTPQRPPDAAPGAAPSIERLIGTWTVTEFRGGPSDGRGEHAASTTYRFQDGGRVTVAGSRQCAYAFENAELKIDCDGRVTAGKVEFRGVSGMAWTIGADRVVILTKR